MRSPVRPAVLGFAMFALTGCGSSLEPMQREAPEEGGGGGGKPLPTATDAIEPTPAIVSISPQSGSSRTVWTIRGSGFSPAAQDNVVRFGSGLATVVSASETMLIVTDAFGARTDSENMPITVESRGIVAGGPTVTALPNGTMRPAPGSGHAFGRAHSFAGDGSDVWVLDADVGLFRHRLSTGLIQRMTAHGEQGAATMDGVFSGPDGRIYVSDVTDAGERRVLRRDGNAWTTLLLLADPMVELVPVESGEVYVVTQDAVRRFAADGSLDVSFMPSLSGPITGAAFQWGALFVSHGWNDEILAIDATTAEVSTFSSDVYAPADLAAHGDELVALDYHGIRAFSAGATASAVQPLPGSISPWTRMRLGIAGSAVLVANEDDARILRVDAQGVSLASAGIVDAYGMARIGESRIVSSLGSCFREVTDVLPRGAIFEVTDAAARIVTTDVCAPYGLAPAPDGAVYFTRSNDEGTASEVGTVRIADGAVTVIATHADGIAMPLIAAGAPDGSVFVAHLDIFTGASSVAKIAQDGTIDPAFATAPEWSVTFSLAVSGDQLWSSDPAMGQLTRVPLAAGGALEPVGTDLAVMVGYDALAGDGAGGVYAVDAMSLSIVQVTSADEVSVLATIEQGASPTALERNSVDGDVEVLDLASGRAVLHAIVP